MFTDSNMSKWVSVESRSELHIGWRSWPRNCETMEVIGTRRFEIQTTFVTSWTSERLGFGGHVELSKLTAFVVHTMVKCCCILFCHPLNRYDGMSGCKMPKATCHRAFTIFQAANIFDARPRRESQVFFDSRCWLLRHPAQDIQTWKRLTTPFFRFPAHSAKLRCPSDESHCDQAQSIICCRIQLLQEILEIWECNAWETYRICRPCFQKLQQTLSRLRNVESVREQRVS